MIRLANKRLLIVMFLSTVMLLASATFYYCAVGRVEHIREKTILASGRIEGDDALIAAKTAGRIIEITAREGDQIRAGEVIAQLDDEQLSARVEQTQANLRQAQARLHSAQQQTLVLARELEQSQLAQQQSSADSIGRIKQAEATVAAAEATLAQAEANYQQALYDAEKFNRLAQAGVESQRTAHQADKIAEAQAAAVLAARKQIEAAQGILIATRATITNPQIRAAASRAIQLQIAQSEAEISAAKADIESAQAQLKAALAARNELKIVAPFDGTIITRSAEPGEVVTAGSTIVTLVNLNKIYLRAFVPASEIGNVRLGQAAEIYLDHNPARAIAAIVTRIDPQATFTPENTYFRDDRVRQVFGIKLEIKQHNGEAKPGMPADARIKFE